MASKYSKEYWLSGAAALVIAFCTSGLAHAAPVPDPDAPQATAPQGQTTSDNAKKDEATELEGMVVQGFRSSLASSVSTKRNNASIVEAVTAEEVGKLPDISIAESLGRLPGLATQRLNGRSNVLSIRGLGPDFSTALLNGREQVTTNDNRGVEFDQYPAEVLNQAVVYKTPFAGLIGQGLAGTVDLRTLRPLDKSERVLAFSGRTEFNGQGKLNPDGSSVGYRFTGVYADQYFGKKLGFAVAVAAQSSPQQIEQFNAWGYSGSGTAQSPLVIGGAKPFVGSNDLDRIGGYATVQWAPTSRITSTADFFYSDFNEENIIRGIEFPLGFRGGTPTGQSTGQAYPNPPVVNSQVDGFATNITFPNVEGVVRNDLNQRNAELLSAGWNTKYVGDAWTAELDLSYSRATRRDQLIEAYAGTGYGVPGGAQDTLTISQAPGQVPQFGSRLNYADPNLIRLTDPLGWGGGPDRVQAGFINAPRTNDELYHLRGSVSRDLKIGFLDRLELGFDYGNRSKQRTIVQSFLTLPNGAQSLPIPQAAFLGENTGLFFLGLGPQVTLDTRYLLDNVYVPLVTSLSSFSTPQEWVVTEKTYTGWAKFNLDGKLGSIPFTGNVGAQFVGTDQTSEGGQVLPSSGSTVRIVPISGGANYTRFLPTLNLNFDITETFKTRIGIGRTLARARLDQLSASQNLGYNSTNQSNTNPLGNPGTAFSISGGNPALVPYLANQFDLSFENYFGGAGYVALSFYYRDLQDFVNTGDGFVRDFSAEAAALLTPAQRASLASTLGVARQPSNFGSGRIRGIEFTASIPLDLVAKPLNGFGFITSTSFTDSRVGLGSTTNPTAPLTTITVPGLSKWVVNSSVYFEKWGFEARLSHRFRTGFLGELAAISATREFRNTRAESILDGQLGYAFKQGPLEGLRLTAQGLNLTDEPFQTTDNDDRRLRDSQFFGRTFLLGASYTF